MFEIKFINLIYSLNEPIELYPVIDQDILAFKTSKKRPVFI